MSFSVRRLCVNKTGHTDVEWTVRSTDGVCASRCCYLVFFCVAQASPCAVHVEDAQLISTGPNQIECCFFLGAFGKYTSSALFPPQKPPGISRSSSIVYSELFGQELQLRPLSPGGISRILSSLIKRCHFSNAAKLSAHLGLSLQTQPELRANPCVMSHDFSQPLWWLLQAGCYSHQSQGRQASVEQGCQTHFHRGATPASQLPSKGQM